MNAFKIFKVEVENQVDKKNKIMRFDRDSDYYEKFNKTCHHLESFTIFL